MAPRDEIERLKIALLDVVAEIELRRYIMSLIGQIKSLAAGIEAISTKLDALAEPAPVDLGPLNEELAKLSDRLTVLEQAPAPAADLTAVTDRLAALEAIIGTPSDPAEPAPTS